MPTTPMTKEAKKAYEMALKLIDERGREGLKGTHLSLSNLGLTQVPPEIGQLTYLRELWLEHNQLTSLPSEIRQLTALTALFINDNQLTSLPPEIRQLTALTALLINDNQLTSLPSEIGHLTSLIQLQLSNNQLTSLPPELGNLRELMVLTLEGNALGYLPESLQGLTRLKELTLHGNTALGLPAEVLGPRFRASNVNNPPSKPQAILDYYFAKGSREPVNVDEPPEKASAPLIADGTDQTEGRAMQDQASEKDAMGRAWLIETLGEIISSAESLPPLSVTIEAPWGEGKSSAMVQLRLYLETKQKVRTFWFNPWRYTEAEALWSGFLAEFTDRMLEGKSFLDRLKMQHRYLQKMHGKWFLLRCIGGIFGAAAVLFLLRWWLTSQLPSMQGGLLVWAKTIWQEIVTWGAVVFLCVKLWFAFNKPVRTFMGEMKAYFKKPDYAASRGSSERLHLEFRAWLEACLKLGERMYVFIDDLDRCAGPRAAELLEWLQLLMSTTGDGDKKRLPLVMVAGLDREKVAAAVAMRHSELLPILVPAETAQAKGEAAIIWGYEYLEKFVDIPVRLPPGSPETLDPYLKVLAPGAFESEEKVLKRRQEEAAKARKERQRRMRSADSSEVGPSEQFSPTLEKDASVPLADNALEDWRIPGVLRAAAVWLNHSPRRLKHFLNLLRLRWAVRKKMGKDRITLELTARLVLIETVRPTLFRALADNRTVREALFGPMDEDNSGIFKVDGRWKTMQGIQVFEADKTWLTKHGMAVLVHDWADILNEYPQRGEEDNVAPMTLAALDALIDGSRY